MTGSHSDCFKPGSPSHRCNLTVIQKHIELLDRNFNPLADAVLRVCVDVAGSLRPSGDYALVGYACNLRVAALVLHRAVLPQLLAAGGFLHFALEFDRLACLHADGRYGLLTALYSDLLRIGHFAALCRHVDGSGGGDHLTILVQRDQDELVVGALFDLLSVDSAQRHAGSGVGAELLHPVVPAALVSVQHISFRTADTVPL